MIYCFQLFGINTLAGWGLFLIIIAALYIISLAVFQIYKIKSSRYYTLMLKQYQQDKEDENAA